MEKCALEIADKESDDAKPSVDTSESGGCSIESESLSSETYDCHGQPTHTLEKEVSPADQPETHAEVTNYTSDGRGVFLSELESSIGDLEMTKDDPGDTVVNVTTTAISAEEDISLQTCGVEKDHAAVAAASEENVLDLNLSDPNDNAEKEYVSCIRIRGKPILPPVMTPELRKECREWKLKAMEKEAKLREQRTAKTTDRLEEFLHQFKTGLNTDTSPLAQSASDPNISSSYWTNSAATESPPWNNSLIVDESSGNELAEREDLLHDDYSSSGLSPNPTRLAVNVQSESLSLDLSHLKVSSRNETDDDDDDDDDDADVDDITAGITPKSFSEIYSEVKNQREKELQEAQLREVVKVGPEPDPDPRQNILTPHSNRRLRYNSEAYSERGGPRKKREADREEEEDEEEGELVEKVGMYDSMLSINTVIEVFSGKESNSGRSSSRKSDDYSLADNTENKENIENDSIATVFRPRRGSYTLDKPSPLLQAHLEKFGSDDEISRHDMSGYQRTPSPYKSEGLAKFLVSKQAAVRPATPLERQEVLDRYLQSLAEKPVPLSLVPRRPTTTPADPTQQLAGRKSQRVQMASGEQKSTLAPATLSIGESVLHPSASSLGLSSTPKKQESESLLPPVASTIVVSRSQSQSSSYLSEETNTLGSKTFSPENSFISDSSTVLTNKQGGLESVVSELAVSHQKMLSNLLARQEAERQQLRREFEAKQQELVQRILAKFPRLSLDGVSPSALHANGAALPQEIGRQPADRLNLDVVSPSLQPRGVAKPHDSGPRASERLSLDSQIPVSIPPSHSASPPNSVSETARESEVNRSVTSQASELGLVVSRAPLILPPEAVLVQHARAWTKLSALAKGFLIRRLYNTEKVRSLKKTIRETIACAVQLHMELDGPPNRQDLDLHGRLLAQLESACHTFHHIFFSLGIPERMSIIALDRAVSRAKDTRPKIPNERRISAATVSRLENKAKVSEGKKRRVSQWSPKRRKVTNEIAAQPSSQRYQEPKRVATTRMTPTRIAKDRFSSNKRPKPAWK